MGVLILSEPDLRRLALGEEGKKAKSSGNTSRWSLAAFPEARLGMENPLRSSMRRKATEMRYTSQVWMSCHLTVPAMRSPERSRCGVDSWAWSIRESIIDHLPLRGDEIEPDRSHSMTQVKRQFVHRQCTTGDQPEAKSATEHQY